jgi:hypothetical protein
MLPCFLHISCVSALGFVHQRPSHWFKHLISCSLSIKILSMFMQDSVVTMLRCYFLPLKLGYVSVAKHLLTCLGPCVPHIQEN